MVTANTKITCPYCRFTDRLGLCPNCQGEKYKVTVKSNGVECSNCNKGIYHWECKNCKKWNSISVFTRLNRVEWKNIWGYAMNWLGATLIIIGCLLFLFGRALVSGPPEAIWIKVAVPILGVVLIVLGNKLANRFP
jgi:hypothetical protein